MRRWPLFLFAIVAACGRSQPAEQSQNPGGSPPASRESAPADPPAPPAPAPPEPVDIAAALADPNRVLLGVVRADNVLIPIAVYSKGRWGGPDDPQMATGEGGVPLLPTWRAWFAGGELLPLKWFQASAPGGTITLTSATPAPVDNHCQFNWAFPVDGPPSTRKTNEHHTNLGIAMTSDQRGLRAIELLPNNGDEANRVAKWLRTRRTFLNERARRR